MVTPLFRVKVGMFTSSNLGLGTAAREGLMGQVPAIPPNIMRSPAIRIRARARRPATGKSAPIRRRSLYCSELLPFLDLGGTPVGDTAVVAERVGPEKQERGRIVGLDGRDDGGGGLGGITILRTVDGVDLFATLASRVGVVRDGRDRLGQRTASEVGAKRARFDDCDRNTQRGKLSVQRATETSTADLTAE